MTTCGPRRTRPGLSCSTARIPGRRTGPGQPGTGPGWPAPAAGSSWTARRCRQKKPCARSWSRWPTCSPASLISSTWACSIGCTWPSSSSAPRPSGRRRGRRPRCWTAGGYHSQVRDGEYKSEGQPAAHARLHPAHRRGTRHAPGSYPLFHMHAHPQPAQRPSGGFTQVTHRLVHSPIIWVVHYHFSEGRTAAVNEMPQAVIAGFAPAMVPRACAGLVLAGFPSPGVCVAKTTATATTVPPALTAALFVSGRSYPAKKSTREHCHGAYDENAAPPAQPLGDGSAAKGIRHDF